MSGLTPGIYGDVAEDAYHADPCPEPSLSHSIAVDMLHDSPSHAADAHPRITPAGEEPEEEGEERFDFGKALHAMFLEGRDVVAIVEAPSWQTKAAKEERDRQRGDGKIPVLRKQADRLLRTLPLLRARLDQLDDARIPFTAGKPEQTLIWQESVQVGREVVSVWCRARLDWLADDYSVVDDLKTAASANPKDGPRHFGRAVWQLGYDIQAAFYARGVEVLTGVRPRVRFVPVETKPRVRVALTELSPEGWAIAEAKRQRAVGLWALCMKRSEWPGYPTCSVALEPPAFESKQWESPEDLF